MREIKFRARERHNKVMGEVRILDSVCQIVQVRYEKMYGMWEFKNIKLMQFTGLQDKNGIDIYEGDILEIPQYAFSNIPEFYSKEVISFEYGRFGFYKNKRIEDYKHVENFKDLYSLFRKVKKNYVSNLGEVYEYEADFEVIGNIYENPELLEV